eukprot:178572-Rhodomonas_salina.3
MVLVVGSPSALNSLIWFLSSACCFHDLLQNPTSQGKCLIHVRRLKDSYPRDANHFDGNHCSHPASLPPQSAISNTDFHVSEAPIRRHIEWCITSSKRATDRSGKLSWEPREKARGHTL